MILILSLSPLVDIVSQGLGPHQSQSKEWNEHDVQFEGRSCREQELEARRNCMRERGRLGLSERDAVLCSFPRSSSRCCIIVASPLLFGQCGLIQSSVCERERD